MLLNSTASGRRNFLRRSTLCTGLFFGDRFSIAASTQSPSDSRSVDLLALHTMEQMKVHFWADGHCLEDQLFQVNYLLRDHRTNQVHAIDTRLLEYLYALVRALGSDIPIHVISGYRSPATNAMLRQNSSGVARRSYHMAGRAIDLRMPEIPTESIRDAAISLKLGGVGYYPKSDFVHLDTGPVRNWS